MVGLRRHMVGAVTVVVVAALGPGTGVRAQDVRTVGELLEACAAGPDAPEALLCGGLVEGVTQVLIWNCVSRDYGWDPDPAVTAGIPPTIGAAIDAFTAWARSHPEQWQDEWQLGLTAALAEAFPCPNVGTRA